MSGITPFDKPLSGYRFVQTNRGDTLQKVALRELGDASNWAELITINNLVHPYLTDDPSQVTSGVILTGGYLTVPSAVSTTTETSADDVFGQDIMLVNGQFSFDGGDFALVNGINNLKQALVNALDTDQNELMFHPTYGSLVRTVIGDKNSPASGLLATRYAGEVVAADPRISNVDSANGAISGDSIIITVIAETIQGNKVPATNKF